MSLSSTFRIAAVAATVTALWPSPSHAEVDRLNLSPIEQGFYVDGSYEGGRVQIGARLDRGWMQQFLITVESGDQATYYIGQVPIFDSKPLNVWLYRADKKFRIKDRALASLHFDTSDRNAISGFLLGKEIQAHFEPKDQP